jgi:tRNA(Ile2)-agmatinylcytidine synthase
LKLNFNYIGSENIWVGIDDTDSVKGGCTTYVALTIIKKLVDEDYDIIGYPRLVRLNPNIPWKTRGNGAISFRVGRGIDGKTRTGEIDDENIFCYSKESSKNLSDSDIKEISNIVENIVDKYARLDDKKTNSGFVITKKQPSFGFYEKTVKDIVSLNDVKKLLKSMKAEYKGYKNCRGLIGATASIAWRPLKDSTYELITYREKKRWGTERNVDDGSVKKMDKRCLSTFDNYDYRNKHNRLVPNSPCPVLYGIRGDDEEELVRAYGMIKSERVDSWLVFETNQGTDDHLQRKIVGEIQSYQSVITKGRVCEPPHTIKGGHVIFRIKDSSGEIDCAAYEPTKEFRNIVRELVSGDVVEVYGGVRGKPLTINLEKINIKRLEKQIEKFENPVCPRCGKHMKSKGKNQGYRCVRCGTKSKKPILREKERRVSLGFYEVPVCARRHISKPLKRMKP